MEKESSHVTSYRQCFNTDAGKRVLANMLIDSGFFDTDRFSPEDIAVQNFMKKIILKLGFIKFKEVEKDVFKILGVDSFVDKLFELPVL